MVTWGTTTVFGASPSPSSGTTSSSSIGGGGGITFGSSAPTPATSPIGGGGFSFGGAAAPWSGGSSLFGSTPAPAPSSSGGLFGGSAPAPSTGGGLFGSTAAPGQSSTGSIFGTTPSTGSIFGAPAPSSTGSIFGAPATSSTGSIFGSPPPSSIFGTQQQQQAAAAAAAPPQVAPAQAALTAHYHASARQEAARIESAIWGLYAAYSPIATDPLHPATPTPATTSLFGGTTTTTTPSQQPQQHPNSLCRFQHIFYDPITPEQRQQQLLHGPNYVPTRPPHVSTTTWSEAVARNPDPTNYVPVCIVGSEALTARLTAQQTKARLLRSALEQVRSILAGTLRQSSASCENKLYQYLIPKQSALHRRLLDVMRKVELCRCINLPLQQDELVLKEQLRQLVQRVNGLNGQLNQVKERAEIYSRSLSLSAAAGGGRRRQQPMGGGDAIDTMAEEEEEEEVLLREEDYKEIYRILEEQRVGLDKLTAIIKKDVRDVNIIKKELSQLLNTIGGGSGGADRIGGGTKMGFNVLSSSVMSSSGSSRGQGGSMGSHAIGGSGGFGGLTSSR